MEPVLDHVEVEDGFKEVEVVRDRVDNGDFQRAMGKLASLTDVELDSSGFHTLRWIRTYIGQLHHLVFLDILSEVVDLVRHLLRSRSTIGDIELDPEVIVRTTGVM